MRTAVERGLVRTFDASDSDERAQEFRNSLASTYGSTAIPRQRAPTAILSP
jgi:hypothetical protein